MEEAKATCTTGGNIPKELLISKIFATGNNGELSEYIICNPCSKWFRDRFPLKHAVSKVPCLNHWS